MGGRGSSSSAGSYTKTSASKLSDKQLANSIRSVKGDMDKAGAQMERHANRMSEARTLSKDKREGALNKARRDYNAASDRYNSLRDKLGILESERAKRQNTSATKTPKKFVNSYGEATRRNITSSSYESAQRSLQKQIDSRFKGR